ncbi:MAG TPA: TetR/AcrR family transcriptional regulator [Thermoleophilaceae bacterium]|nr:TetR/AcrR family transcriptional regulator [Thermoleophilaceae bacterium]
MVAPLIDSPSATAVMTPWGRAAGLRSRQLRPGPGNRPDAVERNQRERLYGATVAAVAAQGYETTRVADILALAGVSRSAFYHYFDNKLECFLATLDALAEMTRAQVVESYRDAGESWHARLQAVFEGIVATILLQPAAARVWMVEVYAAGPEAVDRMEQVADQLELLATAAIGETPERSDMPAEGVRAVLGGLRQIVQTRLRHGRAEELPTLVPELLDWALGYSTPPTRLRKPRKPPRLPATVPDPNEQRRKILATVTELVADEGYQAMTVTEISQRAGVSLTTFYNHFASKREAFMAAIDDGERQLVEIALPAYEQAVDWPHATRDVIHAFFAFNATHPAMAQLGGQRIFSGGAQGFDRHESATGRFGAVLRAGYREYPETSPVVAEAVSGAVAALLYQQIRRRGPESAYEVAGIASFLALAPFVGVDEACTLANQGWRPAVNA